MARRPDARTLLFEKIRTSAPKFVHVTGVPYTVEHRPVVDGASPDVIWMTVEAPPFGRLRVSLNTVSGLNRDGGFEANLRVAIVKGSWTEKPQSGLVEDPGQDYAMIEAAFDVAYESMDQEALTSLISERAKKAVRAEIWGELYASETLGIRQIHCRKSSKGQKTDLRNRDGALKLYYAEENAAELFLFKFDGQK
jgi:hypothetical protein